MCDLEQHICTVINRLTTLHRSMLQFWCFCLSAVLCFIQSQFVCDVSTSYDKSAQIGKQSQSILPLLLCFRRFGLFNFLSKFFIWMAAKNYKTVILIGWSKIIQLTFGVSHAFDTAGATNFGAVFS
jgi:hypothetical protein